MKKTAAFTMLYQIFQGILAVLLCGCQGLKRPAGLQESTMSPRVGTTPWDHKFNTVGKLFGDVAVVSSGTKEKPMGEIYNELWKATLQVLQDFSFEHVVFVAGTIKTPWFNLPKQPGERFKICCSLFNDKEWVKSIAVTVYHEVRVSGQWCRQSPRKNLAFYIKDTILTTARKNKVNTTAMLPPKPLKNLLVRP